jgi:hypothetical protein
MTTVRDLSVSSTVTVPPTSAIFARPFGLRALEQLDHAREAVRDVRAGDAAGVERPHRQLRARLADRLRGDDAHRVADLGQLARGQRAAVAALAHARGRDALEHRAHRDRDGVLALVGLDDLGELRAPDLLALLEQGAAPLGRELLRGHAADQHVVRLAVGLNSGPRGTPRCRSPRCG